MHEMSLCEGILQVIGDYHQEHGFERVKTVWLEIGDLAGVEIEAMRFGWEVVMKGSVVEGAKLEILEVSGEAFCPTCQQKVPVKERFDACPGCERYDLEITDGDQMRIKEMEVE